MLIYSSRQMVLINFDILLLRQIDTRYTYITYVVYIWIFFSGGGGGGGGIIL